jgi:hypothetical protein
MLANEEYLKAQEVLKRIAEVKRRQATTSEAVRRARKRIATRGDFVPKVPKVESDVAKF